MSVWTRACPHAPSLSPPPPLWAGGGEGACAVCPWSGRRWRVAAGGEWAVRVCVNNLVHCRSCAARTRAFCQHGARRAVTVGPDELSTTTKPHIQPTRRLESVLCACARFCRGQVYALLGVRVCPVFGGGGEALPTLRKVDPILCLTWALGLDAVVSSLIPLPSGSIVRSHPMCVACACRSCVRVRTAAFCFRVLRAGAGGRVCARSCVRSCVLLAQRGRPCVCVHRACACMPRRTHRAARVSLGTRARCVVWGGVCACACGGDIVGLRASQPCAHTSRDVCTLPAVRVHAHRFALF